MGFGNRARQSKGAPIHFQGGARAENYETVRNSYDKLKLIDPALAMRFSYLDLRGDEAVRAAEVSEITEVVVWDED